VKNFFFAAINFLQQSMSSCCAVVGEGVRCKHKGVKYGMCGKHARIGEQSCPWVSIPIDTAEMIGQKVLDGKVKNPFRRSEGKRLDLMHCIQEGEVRSFRHENDAQQQSTCQTNLFPF
jgi:hypothetical protein